MNKPEEAFRQNRSREKHYAFDYAFGENSTQVEVFDKTTRFLIDGVLQGFNATVFAYGATGAGKTYTMLGEVNSPGLMLMTFIELFEKIEKLSYDRAYKAKLSYLEIYNEMIRDLLNPSDANIEIREDPTKGVQVANLSEIMAMSPEEVISSIRLGNKRRTQEPTMANETSSRSHAVLQITVEHKDKASGVSSDIMVGKLSLIDLAGSERASNTMNRGLRLIEGANINRSLLALGNCINALCESVEKGTKVYIPYRDSKLTRLLKDSLGGNCRTVMVACISPFVNTYEDTHNTLKYANRAKNIKTNAKRNVFNVNSHISKYTQIISSLKQEIVELRTQLQTKQNSGLINAPVLELHSIEINNHFKHEADLRKRLFEIDQSIEEMGFELFNISTELNGAVKKHGTESQRYKTLKKEQMNIQERIRNRKTELENQREGLTDLIKKRNEIKHNLSSLPEPSATQLNLLLQKNILGMNTLDLQRKEHHDALVIRQKEAYIKLLENQLKLRDNIITKQHLVLSTSPQDLGDELAEVYKDLHTFDEINSYSFFIGQDVPRSLPESPYQDSSKSMPKIKNIPLPPIITSKRSTTPRKFRSINAASRRNQQNIYSENVQQLVSPKVSANRLQANLAKNSLQRPVNKYTGKSNRSNSALTSLSKPGSAASTSEKLVGLNIVEKAISPYSQKPNRLVQEHAKKSRINPKNIKYGVSIRKLEPSSMYFR